MFSRNHTSYLPQNVAPGYASSALIPPVCRNLKFCPTVPAYIFPSRKQFPCSVTRNLQFIFFENHLQMAVRLCQMPEFQPNKTQERKVFLVNVLLKHENRKEGAKLKGPRNIEIISQRMYFEMLNFFSQF